jgi:hypothetical protein
MSSEDGRRRVRFEASVTSISWIPSEAVRGIGRQIFDVGVLHYDDPPPETIGDLEALRIADGFRFANELRAWVEVDDGRIVDCGQTGKGHIGATKVRVGTKEAVFPAIALPDIRRGPESHGDSVRFVQTAGGRTGVPAPRTVRRKPFVQIAAPGPRSPSPSVPTARRPTSSRARAPFHGIGSTTAMGGSYRRAA